MSHKTIARHSYDPSRPFGPISAEGQFLFLFLVIHKGQDFALRIHKDNDNSASAI